jgi:hypothetical protein
MKTTQRTIRKSQVREAFNDARKEYWVFTKAQLYYFMVRTGRIPNSAEAYADYAEILEDAVDSGKKWSLNFDDYSPDLPEGHSYKHVGLSWSPQEYLHDELTDKILNLPDFDRWDGQEYSVKLIVDNPVILRCYKSCTSPAVSQIPVIYARDYLRPRYLYSELYWLQDFADVEEERAKSVFLYLGDFQPDAWRVYEFVYKHLHDNVHHFQRIGINPEQVSGLIPYPVQEDHECSQGFKDIQKEHGIDKFYQLESFDPRDLYALIESSVLTYYDVSEYSIEKEAEWEQVYKKIRKPLVKAVDKVLNYKAT